MCKSLYFFVLLLLFLVPWVPLYGYKLGLEAIPDEVIASWRTMRIALVTNQSGKTQEGQRNIDILLSRGIKLARILAPEHGLYGTVPAGKPVADTIDERTKVPVESLYGDGHGRTISKKTLDAIDLFMVDLQDSGMRHFTYISTLYTLLKAAGEHGKKVVVLDRPNPLGGIMEGPLVDRDLISFISIASIPVRHGLTMGELAGYFNNELLEKPAALSVVKLEDYNRAMGLDGKLLAPLSPNITTLDACYGYSFLGMLGEVRPFDSGFSLKLPFRAIMLPIAQTMKKDDWDKLACRLGELGIETTFQQRSKNIPYEGLLVSIPSIEKTHAFQALVDILDFVKMKKITLKIPESRQKAFGSRSFKAYFDGTIQRATFVREVNNGIRKFHAKSRRYCMYKPFPEMALLQ